MTTSASGMDALDYQEIVERRRALAIEPYKSLAEVGFDGPWVTPYQIISNSAEGPVLVALHWLDEPSIVRERPTLEGRGYLPGIRFNVVINGALAHLGLTRSDIYVTQTFHLIPQTRSEPISRAAIRRSFDEVTRFELEGRKVVALGEIASGECERHKVEHIAVCHPSRRGHTNEKNASEIANAIAALGFGGRQSGGAGLESNSRNDRLWNGRAKWTVAEMSMSEKRLPNAK